MGRPGGGRGGADWRSGGLAWLQRLWRSKGASAESAAAGGQGVLRVEDALADLEARLCEAIALPGGEAPRPLTGAGGLRSLAASRAPSNVFGRTLVSEVVHGAGSAVSLATGMTLAGLRSSAFLAGDELAGARGALDGAASRMAPMVLHVAMGSTGHRGYHAVADSGCFQIFAGCGQQALDLSLVARWLAERALCPGVIATDADGLEGLQVPDAELIRSYLGAPGDSAASTGEAQRILFGSERRRLLAWFDPDRPVATGELGGSRQSTRGRELFFREPLVELARQGMEALSSLTGRPLAFLDEQGMGDAEVVLVAQGAVARCARAVADELRRRRGLRVGVVGITWLRPLPKGELVRAL
ncbi:MAG: hypothetical protein JRG96_07055, partial [Deltaproteobacteria bacterium]|nr:hypothetical protein [Deltaproteobacteria bacterium]